MHIVFLLAIFRDNPMIRKILHSIIAFFVLVSTMGFTLDFHYCHDHLYSVDLSALSNSCDMCNTCGNCSDLSVKIKINDNYLVSAVTTTVNHHIPVTVLNLPLMLVPETNTVAVPGNLPVDLSPPGPGDIHLLTHSFLC